MAKSGLKSGIPTGSTNLNKILKEHRIMKSRQSQLSSKDNLHTETPNGRKSVFITINGAYVKKYL